MIVPKNRISTRKRRVAHSGIQEKERVRGIITAGIRGENGCTTQVKRTVWLRGRAAR